VSGFTRSTYAMHFYESMLVIEKRPVEKPISRTTGVPVLTSVAPRPVMPFRDRVVQRFKGVGKKLFAHFSEPESA